MCCIYSSIICRTFIHGKEKSTKALRLSLADKRNHVRAVLPGMLRAVSIH